MFGCVLPTCRKFLVAVLLGSAGKKNEAEHSGGRDTHLCRNQSDPERSLPTGHRYVGHRRGRVVAPIDRDATRVLLRALPSSARQVGVARQHDNPVLKLHSGDDVNPGYLARCLAGPQVSVMWLVICVRRRTPILTR